MLYYFLTAAAVLMVTGLVWRRYLQRVSVGGLGHALSPGTAGAGLHHVMLALVALLAMRQLYAAALSLPEAPIALPGVLALFAGLALLCLRSTAGLPSKPSHASERA